MLHALFSQLAYQLPGLNSSGAQNPDFRAGGLGALLL